MTKVNAGIDGKISPSYLGGGGGLPHFVSKANKYKKLLSVENSKK
jgi:hypothetical protein